MDPFLRIVPVFLVILAGYAGRRIGLLPPEFQAPANRLAYYLAVPCLIFLKVSQAPFREVFRPTWIVAALTATFLIWLSALAVAGLLGWSDGRRGTFAQASVHSNLGYMGLAVVFYGLGDRGLQVAGVFAAFFMLLNNFLAVVSLGGVRRVSRLLRHLALQPVILGSLLGLAWSWYSLPLPQVAAEALSILGSMGLPLALLLIGSGLGSGALQQPLALFGVVTLKNLALPALGALLLTLAGASGLERAAAVILLASPSATLTLVMARELGGDPPLAAAAVTISTLCSAATLPLWLALLVV